MLFKPNPTFVTFTTVVASGLSLTASVGTSSILADAVVTLFITANWPATAKGTFVVQGSLDNITWASIGGTEIVSAAAKLNNFWILPDSPPYVRLFFTVNGASSGTLNASMGYRKYS